MESTKYRCADCQVEWRNARRHNGDNCWCCNVKCEPIAALKIKKNAYQLWGTVNSSA